MTTISAKEARNSLDELIEEAAESHRPVTIKGERNDAVLISAADWTSIQHRLRSHLAPGLPEFVAHGLASRDEARLTGEYIDHSDVLSDLDALLADAEAEVTPPK